MANQNPTYYELLGVKPGAKHNDTYRVGGTSYFQLLSDFAGRAIRS